jgi:hypothetical protein
MATEETDQAVCDRVRLAHYPEVAGSNPGLATKASNDFATRRANAVQFRYMLDSRFR